jgi:uncharacterized protein (TIGR00266 family)
MEYQIEGTTMQTLILHLNRGDQVYSETGSLLMMSSGVRMTTKGGGLGSMLARGLTGNSLFLNVFEAQSDDEQVMFTTRMPGHIVPFDMEQAYEIVVQRHAFLCAEQTVEYKTAFTLNLGRLLGGNGLMFNYLRGTGMAFVSIDGEVVERQLRAGESILVHPGHIAAFRGSIQYDVELMKGVKNMLFGGDGLYLIRLTGPGHVWLHGVSIHNLRESIVTPGAR